MSGSGVRLRNTGENWRRAEGRLGRIGTRMERAGKWTEDAAAGSAELLLGLAEAARELKGLRGAPSESGDADRRLLPRAPSAPRSATEKVPAELKQPERAPAEPEQPGGDRGKPAAPQPPRPDRPPAAEPPSPVGSPSSPEAPPPPTKPGGTAPVSGRRQRRRLRPDPPDDLPFALRGEILALRERPPQERTRALILKICAVPEWVRPAELARWLGVGAANLTKRHLGPLTEQGLLERRYPESPRHRHQAYRTVKAPPPGGAGPPPGET